MTIRKNIRGKLTEIIVVFLMMLSFPATAQKLLSNPHWLKNAVFYQVYPQSFKDSNGDGIGDLDGIINKLDYVKSLGVTAISLNPCFASTFYDAGYDVTDYYIVAPRYGTNADLKRLFDECHKRGIKVCLDLVAGHTSIKHPWFVASSEKEKNKYSDRYIWTRSKSIKPSDKWVSGDYQRDGCFLKNFYEVQPALNYGYANPDKKHSWEEPVTAKGPRETKEALKNIMAYWMDMGADGFRVDMASSLVKNDPDFKVTDVFWKGMRSWFQQKYPQGVLIAEWGNPEQAVKAHFMVDFMMEVGVKGYPSLFFNKWGMKMWKHDSCYFDKEGNGTVITFLKTYLHQLKAVGNSGYVAIPTANHDCQRPNCGDRNTRQQLKVLMTFILTVPGIPFIYYGDEIGMRYLAGAPDKEGSNARSGSRTPMQWSRGPKAGFSSADTSRFYLPLDPDPDRPDVETEEEDPNSLLNFTKALIALRKSSNALGNRGDFKPLYAKDKSYPFIYLRKSNREEYIVIVNPSDKEVSAGFPFHHINKLTAVLVSKTTCAHKGSELKFTSKGESYAIYKVD